LGVGSWEWLVVGPWELGIEMKIPIEDYVTAAHEAGLREVRLIHGRGKGVQRGIVQQVLEDHPLVLEFWDAPETHLGATVARLSD
jgi:DNA-nicking Smr family endonuclease